MNIGLTEFWIKNSPRPLRNCSNFSILSNWYVNFSSCYYGNGKVFRYQDGVKKYQLSCIAIEDTFYLDFSAAHLKDNILQQMWILKHTTGIEYKLKMKCLWEFFNLPTVEQLNAFAKVKVEQPVIPQVSNNYAFSVEEMRLSTGLSEELLIRQIALPLSEYIDLMLRMTHTRLDTTGVIHHSTVIHNHHHPVVQTISLDQALQELHNGTIVDEPDFTPGFEEGLNEYIDSIVNMSNGTLTYEQIREYSTIVYNHLINVERQFVSIEDLTELVDHPF